MSKRELMQILEQQEWHDKSMWNENGTPMNVVGSKRRRVEEEEEEEGKEDEKEEEKARTTTTKEEEMYFECAGEGEEKKKDDEVREEDVAAMLRREIVNGFTNVLSQMDALEKKLDAIVANTTSNKK
ncbi:unnamed protein product [Bathycoccus prasinos]|jgi:hypothetical protein